MIRLSTIDGRLSLSLRIDRPWRTGLRRYRRHVAGTRSAGNISGLRSSGARYVGRWIRVSKHLLVSSSKQIHNLLLLAMCGDIVESSIIDIDLVRCIMYSIGANAVPNGLLRLYLLNDRKRNRNGGQTQSYLPSFRINLRCRMATVR